MFLLMRGTGYLLERLISRLLKVGYWDECDREVFRLKRMQERRIIGMSDAEFEGWLGSRDQ